MNKLTISIFVVTILAGCGGGSSSVKSTHVATIDGKVFGTGQYKNAQWDLALAVDPSLMDDSGYSRGIFIMSAGDRYPHGPVYLTIGFQLDRSLGDGSLMAPDANTELEERHSGFSGENVSAISDGTLLGLGVPARSFTGTTAGDVGTIVYITRVGHCLVNVELQVQPSADFDAVLQQTIAGVTPASGQATWAPPECTKVFGG